MHITWNSLFSLWKSTETPHNHHIWFYKLEFSYKCNSIIIRIKSLYFSGQWQNWNDVTHITIKERDVTLHYIMGRENMCFSFTPLEMCFYIHWFGVLNSFFNILRFSPLYRGSRNIENALKYDIFKMMLES